MGIVDVARVLVVEYKYDAWGKLPSTTGTLADTLGKRNPFRYRGYVFDEETGLYYLRNRYYNPTKDRFLNADTNFSNGSLFAYCDGNPSVLYDPDGNLPRWLEKTFCAVGSGAMVVAGGVMNTVGSLFGAQAAGGALRGAGMELFDQTIIQDKDFNKVEWDKVIVEAAVGFTTGCVPGSGLIAAGKRVIVAAATETCLMACAYNYGPKEFGWTFIFSSASNMIGEAIGGAIDNFVTRYIKVPNTYTTEGYRAKLSRAGRSCNKKTGLILTIKHNELVLKIANAVTTILEQLAELVQRSYAPA